MQPFISEIERDIWIADGASVPFFGFPYPTRMTMVRLLDQSLWVCSPIALKFVAGRSCQRPMPCPLYCVPEQTSPPFPEGVGTGVAGRQAVRAAWLSASAARFPAWATDIDQVIFHGSFAMEEVVFFHRASRSLIVTDLVQRFDPATLHGWRGMLMRLGGVVGSGGSTPRDWRLSFWNRLAGREALRKALAWNARL
jgi:hypothetical protein